MARKKRLSKIDRFIRECYLEGLREEQKRFGVDNFFIKKVAGLKKQRYI